MKDKITKTTKIEIEIGLDENHVPLQMKWKAEDGGGEGLCKAVMLTLWDTKEDSSMRIDLWEKEMSVYDMQRFFHQTLLTMGDTYERATGEGDAAKDIRNFAEAFAKKTGLKG